MVLGRANEMYPDSMLAFNLAAVPITFLLASEWRPAGRRLVRGVDAVLALALGCAYFRFTWALLNSSGAPDAAGVTAMVWRGSTWRSVSTPTTTWPATRPSAPKPR